MAKEFERMEDGNSSNNPSIHDISDPSRRVVLLGDIGALTVGYPRPLPRYAKRMAGRSGPEPAVSHVNHTREHHHL